MGKSTLNVFDNQDQFKLYLNFSAVIDKSGVVPGCINNPEFFFPDAGSPAHQQDVKIAKRVCKYCPLLDACATYAITAHEREGIWGGLLPSERERKRDEILSKNHTALFARKGFLSYFRLKSKVDQLPRNSADIYD